MSVVTFLDKAFDITGYRDSNSVLSRRSKISSNILYDHTKCIGYGVEITQICLTSIAAVQCSNMVRPCIRIHVVDVRSGYYVHSSNKKNVYKYCTPKTTSIYPLKNSHTSPHWQDESVMFELEYSEIITENTVLLFELLDEKPSMKSNLDSSSTRTDYKKQAWGYFSPLSSGGHGGMRGESPDDGDDQDGLSLEALAMHLNVGHCPHWLESSKAPSSSAPVYKAVNIQLHEYQDNNLICYAQARQKDFFKPVSTEGAEETVHVNTNIPEVYYQWRRVNHKKLFPTNVTISCHVGPKRLPNFSALQPNNDDAKSDQGDEDDDLLPELNASVVHDDNDALNTSHNENENMQNQVESAAAVKLRKIRGAVMKRTRTAKEPCLVPTKLLSRLDVGPEGAFLVSFSHCGHILATCVPSTVTMSTAFSSTSMTSHPDQNAYTIRFFDVDRGVEIHCLSIAHDGVIYSLQWDYSDSMVLTSSSDGTSKCWDVKSLMKMHLQRKNEAKRASMMMLTPSAKSNDGGSEDTETASVKRMFSCVHVPPVYVYSCVFSDNKIQARNAPTNIRTLTGSHDGHIRVWDNQSLVGYLSITNVASSDTGIVNDNQPPVHPGKITALVIDERTKYLVSSDSDGLVLIWKYYYGTQGSSQPGGTSSGSSSGGDDKERAWYRVLRKLRTELCASPLTTVTSLALTHNLANQSDAGTSAASGAPPSQLMVLAPPNQLVSFNMSNFRPTTSFPGCRTTPLEYHKCTLSPDGRFVCACVLESDGVGNSYTLKIWDVISGSIVQNTIFSQFTFPYLIRSVTWHPTQHMIAVSSLGPNAAVMVFYTEKESAKKAARRLSTLSIADVYNSVHPADDATTHDGASERGSVSASVTGSVQSQSRSPAPATYGGTLNNRQPLFSINETSRSTARSLSVGGSHSPALSQSIGASSNSGLNGTGKSEANSELLKRLRAKRLAANMQGNK